MELIECFGQLGFSRQEASLYLLLCREGLLTGYEAAKLSGITRSNVYLALAGLEEKGGAYRSEGEAVRYGAVPIGELVANLRRALEASLAYIEGNVPEQKKEAEPFYTISGRYHVVDKMKNMILQAGERLYISVDQGHWDQVEEEIKKAVAKGRKTVIVTDFPLTLAGATIYQHHKDPGQIRLIVDSSEVLTGEIGRDATANCLYSKNKNLVQLIKDSLTNEIKLIGMDQKSLEN
ncbi:MAG TPA: helix-turn-helix domain-containing protein [Bacillota bacterium]|nr:helix-turn-helix domain-containing protein [Bacillota bacterium]